MTTDYTQWRSMVDEQAYPALPDESVWESEGSSASFYEDNGSIVAHPDGADLRDGEQQFVDRILERSEYIGEREIEDVDNVEIIDLPDDDAETEFRWAVEDGRYVGENLSKNETTSGDKNGIAITVLGPWDVSNVDTLRYYIEGDTETGSSTAGTAIIICDPDATSDDDFDIAEEGETIDSSLDISSLSGDKEIVVGVSQSGGNTSNGKYADIFFE